MEITTSQPSIKDKIKAGLGRIAIYRLSKKPIFIFSNRRGGSTLLMDMIYSQPGIDYISEPLNFWRYHPHYQRLPHPYLSKFISLETSEEKLLLRYFKDLLAGHCRLRNQWNIFNWDYSFHVNRLVVKLLSGKALIDWFFNNFDIEIIYLIRHPIPVSLSIIKCGWGNTADAFLENNYFRKSFLDGDKEVFCRDILTSGSSLERYVLEWCLENLYPLSVYRQRPWLILTYEELVLRPHQLSELICSRFDLPNPKRMYETVLRPTKTSWRESRNSIRMEGPGQRAIQWSTQVDKRELNQIKNIFHVFELKAYSAYNPFPSDELCHFGPLISEKNTL